ncbi:hypothetical protein DLM_1710 [Aquitalea magnusonii]|jgi:hypothetical protein|uniref:Uncharacterized protein n=1 Tax=Aquitalea magnusonii TaxID=332411 RepID=A0A3G9GIH8_9NEIS|nr:hypothetical protein [Aquitalea magnusonii]BBF85327.1 hypothetical protein DLM_1710 [Aquitalea magnusonii]
MTFKLLLSLIGSSLLARQLGSNPLDALDTLSLPTVLLLMTLGNAATYLLVRLLFIRLSAAH